MATWVRPGRRWADSRRWGPGSISSARGNCGPGRTRVRWRWRSVRRPRSPSPSRAATCSAWLRRGRGCSWREGSGCCCTSGPCSRSTGDCGTLPARGRRGSRHEPRCRSRRGLHRSLAGQGRRGLMWILSPLSWLLLAIPVFALGALLPRRRKWLLWIGGAGIAGSVLAMTPVFANRLVGWLEAAPGQPRACETRSPDVAIVLAGGVDRFARSEEDLSVLSISSRRRAEKALGWWREKPGRRLVVAGGSRGRRSVPEATLVAGYLQQLGVPAGAVIAET